MSMKTFIFNFFFKQKKQHLRFIEALNAQIDNLYSDIEIMKKECNKDIKTLQKKLDSIERDNVLLRTKLNMSNHKEKEKKTEKSAAKLKQWADRIKKTGEYKCDICGDHQNLSAHHLWDKNTHPSLMYQDENGVCLCTKCHNEFHNKYTGSQTSPAMYLKFKTYKQALLSIKK